jgi:transcriptional regulator with XRE-family HTH domain
MDRQDRPDKTSDGRSVGEPAQLRREFGRRLRAARLALGYTQEQMAYALGIQPARYGKYEIGRSEAPFDVLIRIAHLAKVDLDYLIAGQTGRLGRRAEPPHEQLHELVQILPIAAVVFDGNSRLLTHNALYREQFFAEQPRLLRRGTPQEVMVRSWAYGQGLSEAEVEVLVRARLNPPPTPISNSRFRVGSRSFHVAETIDPEWRLVLINDLSKSPAEE